MEAQTVAPAAVAGNTVDLRIDSSDASTQNEGTRALAYLRRPLPLWSSVAVAVIFSVFAFLRFGWTPRFGLLVPLLAALAVVIVLDLRTKIIPDLVTLPGIAYALIISAAIGKPPLASAALGVLAGGGIVLLLAIISRGAVGGGDIKLAAMLGAALGWKAALAVLALSQLLAAVVALVLLIARQLTRYDTFPIGVIIAFLGAVMALGGP